MTPTSTRVACGLARLSHKDVSENKETGAVPVDPLRSGVQTAAGNAGVSGSALGLAQRAFAVGTAWVLALGLLGQVASAGAPEPTPRPAFVPWSVSAEGEGVESLLYHGAGLALMPTLELGLWTSARLYGDEPVSGVGGLLGGRLGPLAGAIGLGAVGNGSGVAGSTVRWDVGIAAEVRDGLAFGIAWHGLDSDTDRSLNDYDEWSLSATMRPSRMFSLALDLERLNSPKIGGVIVDPIARVSAGIRPGTERLTIGVEAARTLANSGRWTFGGSLNAMIVSGIALGAYAQFDGDESDFGAGGWTLGATLTLTQGGLSVGMGVDVRDAAVGDGGNVTALLKAGSRRRAPVARPGNLVVRLAVRGPIPERPRPGLLSDGPAPFARWLQAFDIMAKDPAVAGLVLQVDGAPTWAQCWELRAAIARLQAAGKRVHAIMTVGDMKALYLASAADKVHLYAAGGLTVSGLSITRRYYRGLLDKLGVKAEFVKWEDYKSAPESFTNTAPSAPAAEQTQALLDGVAAEWNRAVAAGRKLTSVALDAAVGAGPHNMNSALQSGLVDSLVDNDDLGARIKEDMGAHVRLTTGYKPPVAGFKQWRSKKRVAIVPVTGSIVSGPSQAPALIPLPFLGGATSGDASINAALKRAAADPDVVGIVLRVDSPGGSAIASDKIHQTVIAASKKKPLVVSFGNIAASGGYYVSAGAKRILATPMTVTGSIGIYSGKADLSGLYAMLGVSHDTIRTHERADMMKDHRPFTDAERAAARQTLKAYYDRFVGVVAKGRKLTNARAFAAARGRVYLGPAAQALSLVDGEGGLWDAITTVVAEAGLSVDDVKIDYAGTLGALSSLQRVVLASVGVPDIGAEETGAASAELMALGTLVRALGSGGPLALMPYSLEVN